MDTLLGRWLPALRKRPKRRVIGSPKFCFFDVGVVNFLARRGQLWPGSEPYGKAFENRCFHEMSAYNAYREWSAMFAYWRLATGIEVDFIVNDMELAIEAKSASKVTSNHLKGLRKLVEDHPGVRRRIMVCLEPKTGTTDDGIEILPARTFVKKLWSGELF